MKRSARSSNRGQSSRKEETSQTKRAARRTRTRVRKQRVHQAELVFRNWGGARPGAGRKPKGERPMLPHDKRPPHRASIPLLITTKLLPGLPSLRRAGEAESIRTALALAQAAADLRVAAGAGAAAGASARARARAGTGNEVGRTRGRSAPFQVVHYSIQSNHLHLIVEAPDRAALTSGMRSLLVRIARALNRIWNRSGRVFADRFHERELRTPREVRNALVYVLQNLRKHGICMDGPDPLSSGPEFDGWRHKTEKPKATRDNERLHTSGAGGSRMVEGRRTVLRAGRVELPRPSTWLLGIGWQRHGLIGPYECPVVC